MDNKKPYWICEECGTVESKLFTPDQMQFRQELRELAKAHFYDLNNVEAEQAWTARKSLCDHEYIYKDIAARAACLICNEQFGNPIESRKERNTQTTKITGNMAGELDIKRFVMPGVIIESKCSKCNEIEVVDLEEREFRYPKVNEVFYYEFDCKKCKHTWNDAFFLKVELHVAHLGINDACSCCSTQKAINVKQ